MLASCGGETGGGIVGPPEPTPGFLRVHLASPTPSEGAVLLAITGPAVPAEITSAQPGATVHARQADGVSTVAIFGVVAPGELLRLHVPDVRAAASYQAIVREVAGEDNALRADLAPYQATITRVTP